MHWLGLRKNWLKLKTSGKLPISLEESMEYTRIWYEKPNIWPVGLGNIRILIDYARKISPNTVTNNDLALHYLKRRPHTFENAGFGTEFGKPM